LEEDKDSHKEQHISFDISGYSSQRLDIELKASIRALRKYFKNHFKKLHPKLMSKRLIN
jgi:hypothetical protein